MYIYIYKYMYIYICSWGHPLAEGDGLHAATGRLCRRSLTYHIRREFYKPKPSSWIADIFGEAQCVKTTPVCPGSQAGLVRPRPLTPTSGPMTWFPGLQPAQFVEPDPFPGLPVSFFRRQAFVIATDDQGEIADSNGDAQPPTAPADVAAVPGLIRM